MSIGFATIFTNPRFIRGWGREAQRVATRAQAHHNAHCVQEALELLDNLYCKQNPHNKNPLQMRQTIFSRFLTASMAGYPLAMFFEGLARKEGFGCQRDKVTGQALIQVAGARKCAEAKNYLALCYLRQDLLSALTLLRDAAHDGHALARTNFAQLAEHIRIQLRRRRKIVELSTQPRLRARV